MMKAGDLVKLTAIPPWVKDSGDDIQVIYQFSLGRTFEVSEVREDDGKLALWLWPPDNPFGEQVDVLWVDPEYVEISREEDDDT